MLLFLIIPNKQPDIHVSFLPTTFELMNYFGCNALGFNTSRPQFSNLVGVNELVNFSLHMFSLYTILERLENQPRPYNS